MYNVKGKTGKNDLLELHAPLVKKLAHQLKAKLPPSVEVDDLIQAGMIGLLDAVNRYEETHGAQFETYAVQRIRGAMLDELRSSDWLPRSIRQNARKVEDAMQALLQKLGRQPQENEVAQHMKLSLAEYQAMLTDCGGHQLIYYEDFHDDDSGHEHFLDRYQSAETDNPLQNLINGGFREAVVESIRALPEREQILMGLYYEQEMNLKEIGAVMGVSESRVCQLHSQAISRMRSYLREHAWSGVA
ncbi:MULTISPECIES: RNA polymerase sigma factor FliA [unclassified Herbaspirillum]|uniref:RNA polymerase sigma factor FliA n=1 Tax=unclassified Herbaspirillum TaxID=2624150 RepID=UPI0011517687|nr:MULTISPECIES: RNA polymerase sigma factor FliA [unclassified Herbaspirillum]MBB5392903.1 RNA polymerase sigma factor for flagellar operon FliA [Herbaspirillum sp. SJZ102]TQK04451.1 RNA polymerase sigma-28 (SigD/FliA/WhiG) subunit [Herbaspirillum sp. SJZ130]TQK09764.1 RNA polymerase sigma-28 (SigD/FliA/WhiG) subunit [Herbaspirillum sp. SJZ106]TWC65886.1 RNA polymerase sigma-28 (SigD/FliA/WhiG) subunit [Herbaspirillum sp. SJZ099]